MVIARARFGGAVSFHEHRSGACDVAMRFAVHAPRLNEASIPLAPKRDVLQPYCNRAGTGRHAIGRATPSGSRFWLR